jgi:hypothetical protein
MKILKIKMIKNSNQMKLHVWLRRRRRKILGGSECRNINKIFNHKLLTLEYRESTIIIIIMIRFVLFDKFFFIIIINDE